MMLTSLASTVRLLWGHLLFVPRLKEAAGGSSLSDTASSAIAC